MRIVILCGGLGTRLSDLNQSIPKPMISIGRYPIIWHIMKYYSTFNYKNFILCLGYKGEVIKDYFINYREMHSDFAIKSGEMNRRMYHAVFNEDDWNITFAETGCDAMTGARIKRIRKYIENDDTFMLTYGDGIGNINIDNLIDFHFSHGKILTVTGVHPPGRFGELTISDKNLVTGFDEKPQSSCSYINGGFFVCNKKLFDYLDDKEDLVFEIEPIQKLVADKEFMVYKHDGFWQPMDTVREYHILNDIYNSGKAPWIRWE